MKGETHIHGLDFAYFFKSVDLLLYFSNVLYCLTEQPSNPNYICLQKSKLFV